MVDSGSPQEYIPNRCALGLEATSCSHTDDQVWLKPLAG